MAGNYRDFENSSPSWFCKISLTMEKHLERIKRSSWIHDGLPLLPTWASFCRQLSYYVFWLRSYHVLNAP
jgi:hypothetical protein